MKKILFYLCLTLSIQACIYPFEGGLPENAPQYLVVSGDILIGEQTTITLGYVFPLGTTTGTMVANGPEGTVTVENDKGQKFKGIRQSWGKYIIDTRRAPDNARYRLVINLTDGRSYTTPWSAVYPAPIITDLSYVLDDGNLHFLLSMEGPDSLRNFRWDYTQTWEYHAYFIPDIMFVPGLPSPDNEDPSKIYRQRNDDEDYYYCWNTKSSIEPCLASADGMNENKVVKNNFLSISRSDERLSVLYSLHVTARGLSSAGRAYLYHQSQLSNVTGDLFQPVPSEMKGNVSNVADPDEMTIGYVEVCKRVTQQIYVKPGGVYYNFFDPQTLLYYPEADEDGFYNFNSLYLSGDAPVASDDEIPTQRNVKWGPKRCTDCRAWGGNKNKPDWWPNDHR